MYIVIEEIFLRSEADRGETFHLFAFALDDTSEDAMGGWKKEGCGKPHGGHPSRKGVLDPPFVWYVFHPFRCHSSAFIAQIPGLSRPEALLEGDMTSSGAWQSVMTRAIVPRAPERYV